jgi:CheY-like chemotaxis protein
MGHADLDGRDLDGRDLDGRDLDGEAPLDILIAEDNEVNRIVYSQILAGTHWRWALAHDGVEAVEMFRRHRPALVLMDVSMPDLNGLEATGAIRVIEGEVAPAAPRTPIIGVTAHALKGDRRRCLDAGMDDYLTKPVSPKSLIDKIGQWLARAEQARRSA